MSASSHRGKAFQLEVFKEANALVSKKMSILEAAFERLEKSNRKSGILLDVFKEADALVSKKMEIFEEAFKRLEKSNLRNVG